MTRILLTHPVPVRPNYFPPSSVDALAALGELKTNESDAEWTADELIVHARDCDIVVNYRETPAGGAIFDALPALKAGKAMPNARVLSKPFHLRDLVAEVDRLFETDLAGLN